MACVSDKAINRSQEKPIEAMTSAPLSKGAWTPEEDSKLAEVIAVHGAKRWKSIAAKAGLNRCGKSCRLRWLNYLRPNIKRGNISDQEEDLILRLHKLLGNRWSLIAGRLPGRTDNEIKNYWNSHLSKKIKQTEKHCGSTSSKREESSSRMKRVVKETPAEQIREENSAEGIEDSYEQLNFDANDFFDFSQEGMDWVSRFLQLHQEDLSVSSHSNT